MKTSVIIVSALLGTLLLGALLPMGCQGQGRKPEATKSAKYHCPMHPTIVSDRPGDCPICNMRLVPIARESDREAPAKKIMYRSTMNANEISATPGKDSMGMEMVAFEVEAGSSAAALPGLAAVAITPELRQVMGLKLGKVEKRELTREVRTSARIVADETRLHHVTVKTEGWIGELFVAVTGQEVKKGDRLLTLYSPELVSAQEEYLIALKAPNTSGGSSLLAAARRRLELWDISDEQIKELERSGQALKHLTLYARSSGVVVEKQVFAGHKVMPDESLMTIADLSVVWGDADFYQSDLPYVKVGLPMEMSLPYWLDKTFKGLVIFVSPMLDATTRTLRARLEIPNPELLLKPGMYGDVRLFYQLGNKLSIPEEAVMFSGKRSYAFKDAGGGRLIPTEIKIGARSAGWYELLSGLNEGDQVSVAANFLVDSESSLNAALEAMAGSAGSAAPAAGEKPASEEAVGETAVGEDAAGGELPSTESPVAEPTE